MTSLHEQLHYTNLKNQRLPVTRSLKSSLKQAMSRRNSSFNLVLLKWVFKNTYDASGMLEKHAVAICNTLIMPHMQPLFQHEYSKLTAITAAIGLLYHKHHAKGTACSKRDLKRAFELTELGGMRWFCGIEIIRNRSLKRVWLSQSDYIDKLAKRFTISPLHCRKTPLPINHTILQVESPVDHQKAIAYMKRIGSFTTTTNRVRSPRRTSLKTATPHVSDMIRRVLPRALIDTMIDLGCL
jgi:hypothetical protein